MKTKALLVAVTGVMALAIAACHPKSDSLAPPPIVYGLTEQHGQGTVMPKYIPKVDIVFIIDDSYSMEKYQNNLSANINKFVAGIASFKLIDFHIGVVQIWDSVRYAKIPAVCPDGHRNYEALGALLPLKAPAGQEHLLKNFNPRFVTRNEGFEQVLGQTLKLGAQSIVKTGPCEKGPEVEEIFKPLMASYDPNTVQNQGFWRDDSFKVFVILSDALEGSPGRPEATLINQHIRYWLGASAVDYKGKVQDKFRVYAVTMKPKTTISSSCKPDPGFKSIIVDNTIPDHPIAQLARLSNNGTKDNVLSICSGDYGDQLLTFGEEIKKATLKNQVFLVEGNPNFNNTGLPSEKQFQVLLGDKVLQPGRIKIDRTTGAEIVVDGDWAYRQSRKNGQIKREIIVRGDLSDWQAGSDAQIEIRYANIIKGKGIKQQPLQ